MAAHGALAGGAFHLNDLQARYPRTIGSDTSAFELRLMREDDEAAMLAFTRSLPAHDLLFLRRDIREPKVLSAWLRELEAGQITSLVALHDQEIVGCSAIARDMHSFSRHVGDLRVILAPATRARGLGRLLIQESFLLALALQLEKLTAHMTGDQEAAISVFEDMGFRPEALLCDHVRDEDGKSYDLVILSLDVLAHQSKMELYGIPEAFD